MSDRLSPRPYSSYSSAVPISDGIDDLATILRSVDVDPERSFAEWLGRGGRLTPDFQMGQLGIADSSGVKGYEESAMEGSARRVDELRHGIAARKLIVENDI